MGRETLLYVIPTGLDRSSSPQFRDGRSSETSVGGRVAVNSRNSALRFGSCFIRYSGRSKAHLELRDLAAGPSAFLRHLPRTFLSSNGR